MIHSSHQTTTRTFYRPKIVSYHPNENCSGNDFQSSRPKPARLPAILLNHFNGLFFAFHRVQTICFGYPDASNSFTQQRHIQSQFLKFDDWQRRAISCAFSICVCDIFFATISRLDSAFLSPDDAEIFHHMRART